MSEWNMYTRYYDHVGYLVHCLKANIHNNNHNLIETKLLEKFMGLG